MGSISRTVHAAAACLGGLLLAGPASAGNAVIYVDDDAPLDGNGTTWATAYRFLADALEAATAAGVPMDVHTAAGTYRPDRSEASPLGSGDRFATFRLADGVQVIGGFAGLGGEDPDERDVVAFATLLSGDLAADDAPGFVNIDENCYHVVTASDVDGTAGLDGLTITAGHADGELDARCFGGESHGLPCGADIDCHGGVCVSLDSTGAGLIALGGCPTISNCRIVDNFARFQGAGMMLKAGSDAVIVGCLYSGNRALDNGGAMYLGQSSPFVFGCQFIGNSGGNYAGASCNRDHSDAIFIDCEFVENTAAETDQTGGGAIVNASSSPSFSGCVFTDNTSIAGNGGAMYNKRGFHAQLGPSRPVVTTSVFTGNHAEVHGGAIYSIEDSEASLASSTLSSNSAERGGAVYIAGGCATELLGCDVLDNAAFDGGGVYNEANATVALSGTDLGRNTGQVLGGGLYSDGTASVEGGAFTLNESGGAGGGVYSTGTLTAVDVVIGGNTSGASPYIGGGGMYIGGVATLVGVTFVDNDSTYNGGGLYVDDLESETTTVTDCAFIGNTAAYGGGIYGACDVLDSTFTQNEASTRGGGMNVAGGFAVLEGCLFTGNRAEDAGGLYAGIETTLTLDACTFTSNVADPFMGGAIKLVNVSATLTGCVFDQNMAFARGGALSISNASDVTLADCDLRDNWAGNTGGAIRLASESSAELTDCVLRDNLAMTAGALYINESALEATGCRLIGNAVGEWGGAVYAAFSSFLMTNCEIAGNFATGRAGAIYLFRSSPRLTNCTITENRAGDEAGGIFNQLEANPILANCILWENADNGPTDESAQITHLFSSASIVEHSCVHGWTGMLGGTGNIGDDPLLADAIGPDGEAGTGDEDLRLGPGSPCVDAASNFAVPMAVTVDLAGEPRFVDDPDAADTGAGKAPIVDMGALERQVATCPADVDDDGEVGFSDLLLVLFAWGSCDGCPEDVDGDGSVAFQDLLAVLFAWGGCG